MTETIDISEPDYPGESIPNIAGGRIWKQSPQEDGALLGRHRIKSNFRVWPKMDLRLILVRK